MFADNIFSGQTVLITGGATGLGFAIAEAFGTHGAAVALNDLGEERVQPAVQTLERRGITVAGFSADVRSSVDVQSMVDDVEKRFGSVDVLVANAGLYPNTPFLELSEDEWSQVFDVNVKGVFLTAQSVARSMKDAGTGGQIITLSSGAARAATRGWSHYCASKAAIEMLTRSMALELAAYDIRVNAIAPGYIDVPEGGKHLDPGYRQQARESIPRGRPGTPEDIANAAILLASPLADYVTGTTLVVDGGSSAGRLNVHPVLHSPGG